LTHASSVIPVVRSRDGESFTLTRAFPLNTRAFPNLPVVVHVALTIDPVFPTPDESVALLPEPVLNAYAATSPGVGAAGTAAGRKAATSTAESAATSQPA
jgi:hypothetical protein